MGPDAMPRLRRAMGCAAVALCGAWFGMSFGAASAATKTTEILAFGDSLTSGFGLPPDKALPVRLEAKLHADGLAIHVINGGVARDTTAGGLARLDWAPAQK